MRIFDNRNQEHKAKFEALFPGDAFMYQDMFHIKVDTITALVYNKVCDTWSLVNIENQTIVKELNVDIYIEDWED